MQEEQFGAVDFAHFFSPSNQEFQDAGVFNELACPWYFFPEALACTSAKNVGLRLVESTDSPTTLSACAHLCDTAMKALGVSSTGGPTEPALRMMDLSAHQSSYHIAKSKTQATRASYQSQRQQPHPDGAGMGTGAGDSWVTGGIQRNSRSSSSPLSGIDNPLYSQSDQPSVDPRPSVGLVAISEEEEEREEEEVSEI
jgi:hypothetical protein